MRDKKRIPKVLKEIGKIWKKHPDYRLMQLLLNCDVIYQTEDDVLVERLKETYEV